MKIEAEVTPRSHAQRSVDWQMRHLTDRKPDVKDLI